MNDEDPKEKKKRTLLQNRALHLYFTKLANELNGAGYDMRKVLKPGIEIPWNPEMIKNHLWRPIQIAQLDKVSTTELNTKDIDEVYQVISKHMADKFGIDVPWPSEEELLMQSRVKSPDF